MTLREQIARAAYPDLWEAVDREAKRKVPSNPAFCIKLRKEKYKSLGLADRLLARFNIEEK